MIAFNLYDTFEISQIAEFERAKQGHTYPSGTTIIQISATKGQVGFLTEPKEVESKYVTVIPIAGINHKYLNLVIENAMPRFLNKYQTGLNIQFEEIGKLQVYIHNQETQEAVVKMMKHIENKTENVEREIEMYEKMKLYFLENMMV